MCESSGYWYLISGRSGDGNSVPLSVSAQLHKFGDTVTVRLYPVLPPREAGRTSSSANHGVPLASAS